MSQSDRLYSVVYDMDIEAGGMYEVDCLRTLVFAALNSLDWESSIWGVSFSRSFCYSRIRAHSLSCTYGSTQSSFLGTFISSALCYLTVERLRELDSRKLLRGSGESPFGTRSAVTEPLFSDSGASLLLSETWGLLYGSQQCALQSQETSYCKWYNLAKLLPSSETTRDLPY